MIGGYEIHGEVAVGVRFRTVHSSVSRPSASNVSFQPMNLLSRPAGHPLPALRGEGRERGADLVHGPDSRPNFGGVPYPGTAHSSSSSIRPLGFMAPTHVRILEVFALHEHPSALQQCLSRWRPTTGP